MVAERIVDTQVIGWVPISIAPVPTGWMDPMGHLFPCSPYEHRSTASRILQERHEVDSIWSEYDEMYRRHYIHITEDCACDMGYGHEAKHPNSAQIDALWRMIEKRSLSAREEANIKNFIMEETRY